MIFAGLFPAERLNRARRYQEVLEPLLRRIIFRQKPIPAVGSGHENEAEIVNVPVEFAMLKGAAIFFGGSAPLRFAGIFISQPHHPGIKARAPISPDKVGPSP